MSWQSIEELERKYEQLRTELAEANDEINRLRAIGTNYYSLLVDADKELAAMRSASKLVAWPESVMQQWDFWRKQIADGDKSSAPRDWFESLAQPTHSDAKDAENLLLRQQKNAFVDAFASISERLRLAVATVPSPENKGTIESAMATGLSIALLIVEDTLAKIEGAGS